MSAATATADQLLSARLGAILRDALAEGISSRLARELHELGRRAATVEGDLAHARHCHDQAIGHQMAQAREIELLHREAALLRAENRRLTLSLDEIVAEQLAEDRLQLQLTSKASRIN